MNSIMRGLNVWWLKPRPCWEILKMSVLGTVWLLFRGEKYLRLKWQLITRHYFNFSSQISTIVWFPSSCGWYAVVVNTIAGGLMVMW
ncbi:hypothetical protein CFP56_038308 [Quercus suber]|uniref:Uncharacterized protein n=1 Tax=Quercus suber TaxID=58331 RepID=A0AAW0LLV8_QUESU